MHWLQSALAASRWKFARRCRGCAAYAAYLIEIGRDGARWKNAELISLSKGRAIGTAGWRKALAKEYGQPALKSGLHQEEVAELREGPWESGPGPAPHRSPAPSSALQPCAAICAG